MIANYGFYLLFLAGLLSFYGTISAMISAYWRHRQLYLSSKAAVTLSLGLSFAAALLLWYAFFTRDYSVAYVAKVSSNDLPDFYRVSAFWSSLEGSHFLWTLLLQAFAVLAIWTHADDNEHIMPYVAGSLQAVLSWMYYLLCTHSDPFKGQFPTPPNGQGMNELLQNPYMAIHPPLLFIGYTACAIPFAYAIAALCYGDITEGWLKSVRRWNLVAWTTLSAAITLGGRWAYVELGWAGYWAWDPVENSSFMPWLLSTALLHSLLVQDKLGHLKRLSIVLAILAFFMSFFGTFITRSGVISSVHSFAESPIGPNYLSYLGAIATISTLLYAWRAPSILPAESQKSWGISKESALVMTQFLLLSFAAIVFVGTIFPIISEAITRQRITVQEPYFNTFAPYFGLGMITLVAIGNLLRYQKNSFADAKPIVFISIISAIPLSLWFMYMGDVGATVRTKALVAQVIGIFFCFWTLSCLCGDFYLKLRDLRFRYKLLFTHNLAYLGGLVAHFGLIVAVLGFLGNYRGLHTKSVLEAGAKTELYGYEFQFAAAGMSIAKEANYTLFGAPIRVSRPDKEPIDMVPAQALYPTKNQLFNEIAVHGGLWHDIYIVLSDYDRDLGKKVTLDIHINPTVRFVWIAVWMMCIGGIIALLDQKRGNKSRDVVAASWGS